MNMHDDPFAGLPPPDDMPSDDRFGPPHGDPREKPMKPFRFVAVGDLEYRPPEFLVEGLIETETLGLVFGEPGCGKSFFAVDLALSVASGVKFHGRAVRTGPVFYIAGEGHNGLVRRFAAWSKHHGKDWPMKSVPLFKSERAAQFLDSASALSVAQAVQALAVKNGAPSLIIVDTLARNFGPGDENSTAEMSQFVAAMDNLRDNWPNCTLLIIHHSGHDAQHRARGAIALKGALDFEFRLSKDGAAMTLANTKMKDADPPADMHFDLTSVDLGEDVSSAVLVEGEVSSRPAQKKETNDEKLARQTYIAAAKDHGIWDGDTFKGVHLNDWRPVFYTKHTGDKEDTKRKAFQRGRNHLVDGGKMDASDDVYLTTEPHVFMCVNNERDKRDRTGH
ncbi:helicase RepA family protein [Pseudogemmobacter faecipullorum]|uniref:AAA family ATPase n=1 Tax=Pseudogemmobacter faecipullorum TaxID=2755041 RepID=A0ABS8CJ72_9RHOB|nr:helicase RepA family protein [Pseudogemmobacter faecipullorum]MCB5409448.1 AAA family ATPase [Pseudogemmobacter faecipullorum]